MRKGTATAETDENVLGLIELSGEELIFEVQASVKQCLLTVEDMCVS